MKLLLILSLILTAGSVYAGTPSEDPQVQQLTEKYLKTKIPTSVADVLDGTLYYCLSFSAQPGAQNPQLDKNKKIFYNTITLDAFNDMLIYKDQNMVFSFTKKGLFFQGSAVTDDKSSEYIIGIYIRTNGPSDRDKMIIQRTIRIGKYASQKTIDVVKRLSPGLDTFSPAEKLVEILTCQREPTGFTPVGFTP